MTSAAYFSTVSDEVSVIIAGIKDTDMEAVVGTEWNGFFSTTETAPSVDDSDDITNPLIFVHFELSPDLDNSIERLFSGDVIGQLIIGFNVRSQVNCPISIINECVKKICEEFDTATSSNFTVFSDASVVYGNIDDSGHQNSIFQINLILN